MLDDQVTVTEYDVKDQALLLRFLRKLSSRVGTVSERVGKLERAPAPPSFQRISKELGAGGAAPLNVQSLPGQLYNVQRAGATRYSTAPTGQVLQQLQDTQLILVGTTSTGYALNAVVVGNPTSLYQLLGGLSTSAVTGSTSTDVMTLTTVQTATGAKTFGAPIYAAVSTAAAPAFTFSTSTNTGLYSTSTGTVALAANGAQVELHSTVGMTLPRKIVSYNGDTLSTAANGVPTLVARSAVIGIATSTLVNLWTPPVAGEYRLSYYLQTVSTGLGTVIFSYIWSDTGAAHGVGMAAMSLAASNFAQGTFMMHAATSGAISYTVSTSSGGTYGVFVTLERLS